MKKLMNINYPNEDTMILLSGGVESSILLQSVKKEINARVAATFLNVGQESAKRQQAYAQRLCNNLGIPLHIYNLPGYVDLYLGVTEPPYAMQDETSCTCDCASLLAVIAAWRLGFKHSYRAFTISDSERIPDIDDVERLKAIQNLTNVLTRGQHNYDEPFLNNKYSDEDVLSYAIKEKFEYAETWSCQWGYRYHCGECIGCDKRKRKFNKVINEDKTCYLGKWPDAKTSIIR